MKIVGLVSSPRKNGNTAVLTREVLKGAEGAGVSVEEIYLPDLNIGFCKGCFNCLAKGKCAVNDDFNNVKEKLLQADGIVISSPSYGLAPSAIMKNFLDRIGAFNAYTSSLAGKYVVAVSAAGAVGAKSVANGLAKLVASGAFKRGYISGILAVKVGWKKTCSDKNTLDIAQKLGVKLKGDIENKNSYPLQNLFGRLINRMIVRKAFTNNILAHKDGAMRAVYDNLLNRGLLAGERK